MGAYAYCPKCEHSIQAPWNVTTTDLLLCLLVEDAGVTCLGCGETYNNYGREALISEIAERIDAHKGAQ